MTNHICFARRLASPPECSVAFIADALVSIDYAWTCEGGYNPNSHHLEHSLALGANSESSLDGATSQAARAATSLTYQCRGSEDSSNAVADMWDPYRATGLKLKVSVEVSPDKLGGKEMGAAAAAPAENDSSTKSRSPCDGSRRHRRADSDGPAGRRSVGRGLGSSESGGGGGSGGRGGGNSGRGSRTFFAERMFGRSRAVSDGLQLKQEGEVHAEGEGRFDVKGENRGDTEGEVVCDDAEPARSSGDVGSEQAGHQPEPPPLTVQVEENNFADLGERTSATKSSFAVPEGPASCPPRSSGAFSQAESYAFDAREAQVKRLDVSFG